MMFFGRIVCSPCIAEICSTVHSNVVSRCSVEVAAESPKWHMWCFHVHVGEGNVRVFLQLRVRDVHHRSHVVRSFSCCHKHAYKSNGQVLSQTSFFFRSVLFDSEIDN